MAEVSSGSDPRSAAARGPVPRVSVVMPVHNGERFLGAAIASVLFGTLSELELLLLDDGSTDRTAEIATEAVTVDPRVRLIRLPSGGVTVARNRGLAEARSKYIANLDADDLMLPGRLAAQADFLDANPAVVGVGSRVMVIDENNRPSRALIRAFSHAEIDGAHLAKRGGALANPSAMFRRDAALEVGGYREKFATSSEDYDLWLRLAEVGELRNLPAILTLYRIHGANMTIGADKREEKARNRTVALTDAFARRGITDRLPAAIAAPPLGLWERRRDAALVCSFRGHPVRAVVHGLVSVVLRPGHPTTWNALSNAVRGLAS